MLVMVSVALSAPTIEGVKVMGIAQVDATVPVHVFAPITKSAAFGPLTATLVKVTDPPLVVPLTVCSKGELTGAPPKATLVGLNERPGAAATPVPDAATVSGLPAMELAIEIVPLKEAGEVGVNAKAMLQLAEGAKLLVVWQSGAVALASANWLFPE